MHIKNIRIKHVESRQNLGFVVIGGNGEGGGG